MQVDVTDEADIRRVVQEVRQQAGPIDVLVNLVGGFAAARLVETETALWQRMLTMNLTSAFLLSKAVLPHMMERRTGRIIHVAARAALDPFPGAAAYIVAKAGLAALILTLVGAVLLVLDIAVGRTFAAWSAGVLGVVLIGLWFVLPLPIRSRNDAGSAGADGDDQQ